MKDVTAYTSTLYGVGTQRYSVSARWFHWVTAVLVFAVVPLGLIFAEFKVTPGSQEIYVTAHKSIGLIIFGLVVLRIAYRFMNPPPVLPGRMAAWEKGLSHASHWLLYLVLLVMPISGYIMSSAGKYPISFVGLFNVPKLPIGKDVGETAQQVHVAAQFALYALVILHIGATGWHLFVRRDNILGRMLPRQANAE